MSMKESLWKYLMGFFLLVLLLLPFVCLRAEEAQSFGMGLDYASFRDYADTTHSYVEIYYSFNRRELTFVPQEKGLMATVLMQLSISDEQGNEVENRMWNTLSQVGSAEEAEKVDYLIIDQIPTSLVPGKYNIHLKATDINSASSGETTVPAEVKRYSSQKLQLSDLELAFSIEADTTRGRLTKAGQKVRPNPLRAFTHKAGMMYFYAELYNLVDDPSAKQEYELRFNVLDKEGKKIKDFGKQSKTKPGNSAVVMSGINISTLAGGEHVLQLEAKDKETGKMVTSNRDFLVIRQPSEEELMAEQIKRFKNDVAYIALPDELDMFDELNFSGKQNFINEFWKRRDPNPETPENEFKMEHYRLLNYANLHFSRTQEAQDGWNTDMGRVYITYGEPSEIERHVSSRGIEPWEQWNYHNLEGGVYFIFLDEDGYGVYRLVHSNYKREVHDADWEEKIKSGTFD
jgi:GWxTD domain-containing protein